MRQCDFILFFACADICVIPEESLYHWLLPISIDFYPYHFHNFLKNICASGKKVYFLVSEVNIELRVLFVILSKLLVLELCGVLAFVGIISNPELLKKTFITNATHSFSQFHSDEFKVQWVPMSHLVRGPTSHLVWPNAGADYGLGTIGTCLGPPPAGGPSWIKKKKKEKILW